MSKVQDASSILKVVFALSKRPHLHRAYLVTVSFRSFIAVCDQKLIAVAPGGLKINKKCYVSLKLLSVTSFWVSFTREKEASLDENQFSAKNLEQK